MTEVGGAHLFLSLLEDEGVEYLFGNPGTTELPLMAALPDHPAIKYVLGLQESVVLAMADGYARASGKLGVCNVHVAPGLGNALGSLYNAKRVGAPVLVTAGQHEQGHGLTEPLLYDPLLPMAEPLVKWAVEVTRTRDLPRIIRRAAKVATSAPMGPVFVSLPGDIMKGPLLPELSRSTQVETETRPTDSGARKLSERLLGAERPALIAGHLGKPSDCFSEVGTLASALGAAVYQQTVPHGAHFSTKHPNFMGALSRNQQAVRDVLERHDVVLCLGGDVLQMSLPSDVEPVPDSTALLHIGSDDREIAKNYPVEIGLRASVRETLHDVNASVAMLATDQHKRAAEERNRSISVRNWSASRKHLSAEIRARERATPMDPDLLMLHLADRAPSDGVFVEEALVSGRALLSLLDIEEPHRYFGLATGGIGFAIGGAIGISLALGARRIMAVIGDGSALYGIQALWTAAHLKTPITYVITNNRGYRILKERVVALQPNTPFIGMDLDQPAIRFAALAQSMGVPSAVATDIDEFDEALDFALTVDGPYLIEAMVRNDV